MGRRVRAWLTRPGLHFVVIGVALFVFDRARQPAPALAPPTGRLAELRADFVRSEAGRSAESLEASMGSLHGDAFDFGALSSLLRRRKVLGFTGLALGLAAQALDEELLYREALARGLGTGPAIRFRLAEKVRFFDENDQRDQDSCWSWSNAVAS